MTYDNLIQLIERGAFSPSKEEFIRLKLNGYKKSNGDVLNYTIVLHRSGKKLLEALATLSISEIKALIRPDNDDVDAWKEAVASKLEEMKRFLEDNDDYASSSPSNKVPKVSIMGSNLSTPVTKDNGEADIEEAFNIGKLYLNNTRVEEKEEVDVTVAKERNFRSHLTRYKAYISSRISMDSYRGNFIISKDNIDSIEVLS